MTFFDQSFPAHSATRSVRPLLRLLDTPFDMRSRRIRARIAELRAMSDEELAERGTSRADIVRHVLMSTRR